MLSPDVRRQSPALPWLAAAAAALAVLPAAASVVEFASYHGGCRGYQGIQDLAVDAAGDVWVAGYRPWDCDQGPLEVHLAKYTAAGERVALEEFGGHLDDEAKAVAIDAAGNLWVAGTTRSSRCCRPFPTVDPLQADNAGGADAFLTRLDPSGATILYSTFLGGSGDDRATGLAIDPAGRIVIAGVTTSSDFPTFAPTQPLPGGGEDAFVAILEPDGSRLTFATYLGGSGDDAAARVALAGGSVLVAGTTTSSDLPVAALGPAQPYQAVYGGGSSDAFAARWTLDGGLEYVTYFGGAGRDRGEGVAAAPGGAAVVAGTTDSLDLPTRDPLQDGLSYPPAPDAFVARFDAAGSRLEFATYLPTGVPADCPPPPVTSRIPCAAVAVDAAGTLFVTAAGAFLIEVDPAAPALSGHYGFGGSVIAPAGPGAFYVAGRTGSPLLPTWAAHDPWRRPIELEKGWLIRLRRGDTPGAQHEEDDPRIAYFGDWAPDTWQGHSGRTARRAGAAGARATIEFEGTGIRLLGRRDPSGGIVRISLDADPERQALILDVHAPQPEGRSSLVSFTGLAPGRHTLTVEVTGTASERASGSFFWLDGFEVVGVEAAPAAP